MFRQLVNEAYRAGKLGELIIEMQDIFDKALNDCTSPVCLSQAWDQELIEEGEHGWDVFVIWDEVELAEKVEGAVYSIVEQKKD